MSMIISGLCRLSKQSVLWYLVLLCHKQQATKSPCSVFYNFAKIVSVRISFKHPLCIHSCSSLVLSFSKLGLIYLHNKSFISNFPLFCFLVKGDACSVTRWTIGKTLCWEQSYISWTNLIAWFSVVMCSVNRLSYIQFPSSFLSLWSEETLLEWVLLSPSVVSDTVSSSHIYRYQK